MEVFNRYPLAVQERLGDEIPPALVDSLRRQALADTELAQAQVDTIRLKLLKIGARVVCSVRRVVIHLAESYPLKDLFLRILGHLRARAGFSLASG